MFGQINLRCFAKLMTRTNEALQNVFNKIIMPPAQNITLFGEKK